MRLILFLLAAALAEAQPQTASLEGTVLNEVTGAPVPRAVVKLEATPAIKPQPTTFTDAEGRFRFDRLPAGAYSLTARKRGFLDVGDIPRQVPLRVRLDSGQHRGALVYKLTPQAIITGRVFDEFDEPVEGAYVGASVVRRAQGRVSFSGLAGVTTNDRGEFRLIGLPPGQYLVTAAFTPPRGAWPSPAGARPESHVTTFYPSEVDTLAAQPVVVSAGAETAGIDIRLRKLPVARVWGRVSGPVGGAPRSFELRVLPTRGSAPGVSDNQAVRTGADGAFEIRDLRPGNWILLADAKESGSGNVMLAVNGEDVENLRIQLHAGFPLNGTLVLDGASGGVDWKGHQVVLSPADGSAASRREAAVSPDGSFALQVQQPDRYVLSAHAPAQSGLYVASIRAGGSEVLGREIDLTSGAPGSVRIVFRRDGGRLRCSVERSETTDRPPDVAVLLLPAGPSRTVKWIEDGAAEFGSLAPGDYRALAVEGMDWWSLQQGDLPQALLDAAVKVHIDPNGAHTLTLKPVKVPEP